MGKVSRHSLKRTFIFAVAVTVFGILILSLLAIYGSYRLQKWIMPDSNEVWVAIEETLPDGRVTVSESLVEYGQKEKPSRLVMKGEENLHGDISFTVNRRNERYTELTPKRKAAYRFLQVMMFFLPVFFSAAGVSLCGWWFYKKKMMVPLTVLSDATKHICQKDLDFSVDYRSEDELGKLCSSFEEMRKTLCENNRELWNMIENRKNLQISIAHDLRTPITIMKGYVEYLQKGIAGGNVSQEKEEHILQNLSFAAQRLERYTESVRDISQLEEMEIQREHCRISMLMKDLANDFTVLGQRMGKSFTLENELQGEETGDLDKQCFCRVLENIVTNALRYAEGEVKMSAQRKGKQLWVCIEDDGPGFSTEQLRDNGKTLFYSGAGGEHFGMGLAVSRILCTKMGGGLRCRNREQGGAAVTAFIQI